MITEKIEQLRREVEGLKASNADEVEQLRVKYLSRKGLLTELMNDFRLVPAEQKKEVGMKINELKQLAQERINELREQTAAKEEVQAQNAALQDANEQLETAMMEWEELSETLNELL